MHVELGYYKLALLKLIVDCATVTTLSSLTSDPVNCHLDSTCNKVSCCVTSAFTSRTFETMMDIDPCTRMLTLEIEGLKAVIPWTEIRWGKSLLMMRLSLFSTSIFCFILFCIYEIACMYMYFLLLLNRNSKPILPLQCCKTRVSI